MSSCINLLTKVKNNISYKLSIDFSSIPNSGNGVFLNGNVIEGEVIALYPGSYFPPPPVLDLFSSSGDMAIRTSDFNLEFNNVDSEYSISCNNCGGYIDGSNFKTLSNFHVGHLINHPILGNPNVMAFDFYWNNEPSNKRTEFESNYIKKINPLGKEIWYIDPLNDSAVLSLSLEESTTNSYQSTVLNRVFR